MTYWHTFVLDSVLSPRTLYLCMANVQETNIVWSHTTLSDEWLKKNPHLEKIVYIIWFCVWCAVNEHNTIQYSETIFKILLISFWSFYIHLPSRRTLCITNVFSPLSYTVSKFPWQTDIQLILTAYYQNNLYVASHYSKISIGTPFLKTIFGMGMAKGPFMLSLKKW